MIDVDEVDFVIRVALHKSVSFIEIQVKSARSGLALSKKFLETVDAYDRLKGVPFWLLICADRPSEMEDVQCIFSNNMRGLLNGRHSLTPDDILTQMNLRDAIEIYIDTWS